MKTRISHIVLAAVLLICTLAVAGFSVFADDPEGATVRDVTFRTPLRYDSSQWQDPSEGDPIINAGGTCYHADEEDRAHVLEWLSGEKAGFAYDAAEHSLTLTAKADGAQKLAYRPFRAVETQYPVTQISLYYEQEKFPGLQWQGWDTALNGQNTFFKIDKDGKMYLNKGEGPVAEIGQLSAGWNTVTIFFIPHFTNYAVATFSIYFLLNQPLTDGGTVKLSAITAQSEGILTRAGGLFEAVALNLMPLTDSNTSAENPAELKIKDFKTFDLEDTEAMSEPSEPAVYDITTVYDSTSSWSQSSNNDIVFESWGGHHKSEWADPKLMFWNKTGTDASGNAYQSTYDAQNCAITLYSPVKNGNGFQLYLTRGTVNQYGAIADKTLHAMLQFDLYYEKDHFDGFRLTTSDSSTIVQIDESGSLTYGEEPLAQLKDGWNTVTMVILNKPLTWIDEAMDGCEVYVTLNAPTGSSIGETDLTNAEKYAYFHWSIGNPVLMMKGGILMFRLLDSDATAEAPSKLVMKDFRLSTLRERVPVTVSFEGYPDAAIHGESNQEITLPAVDGVAQWVLGDRIYLPGDPFIPEEDVTFTAITQADLAWQMLADAKTTVKLDKPSGLPGALSLLQTALDSPYLDKTDARYTEAAALLAEGIAKVTEPIQANVTAAATASSLAERYQSLIDAIKGYQRIVDLLPADAAITSSLTTQIDAYNALIKQENRSLTNALTVAVNLGARCLTGTNVQAILTDIRSKAES